MARKAGVLEFRRPKRRYVAVKRRPSKFRPAGRVVPARTMAQVSPALGIWILAAALLPVAALMGVQVFL